MARESISSTPTPAFVFGVVAGDEGRYTLVCDPVALDQPVPAAVEGQPSVNIRDVRPFGHGTDNYVVHALSPPTAPMPDVQRPPPQTGDKSLTSPGRAVSQLAIAWMTIGSIGRKT